MREAPRELSPPQIAALFGVNVGKVLRWIKAGELRAVNVANDPKGKKPRWKITRDALQDFERARAAVVPDSPPPVRKKRPADVIEFY